MDWAEQGLLDGLEGNAREVRTELLDRLHEDGASLEELRAAVEQDRLVVLPVQRTLMSPPHLTLAQLAEHAGVDADTAADRLRRYGVHVPEDADLEAFSDEDVEAIRRISGYLEAGFSPEQSRAAMHVLAGAMARAAEPLRRMFAEAYLQPGDDELALATRYSEMAEYVTPMTVADLEYLLRRHLRDAVYNDAIGVAELSSGKLPDAVEITVAFADIVGFTQLGQEVPEVELTDIAERLDELATETMKRPARVVKTIGDAVMVVSREPAALLESMLSLLEAADAADGFPPLRAGVACGRAVSRLGDWFGPPVNLAARLTDRARPESVLAHNAVREALGDAADRYAFSEAGLKRFKGFNDPVPTLRVRRPE